MSNQRLETVQFNGYTFIKPTNILPVIPEFSCCNGIHKAVGEYNEKNRNIGYYPVMESEKTELVLREVQNLQTPHPTFKTSTPVQKLPSFPQLISKPSVPTLPQRHVQTTLTSMTLSRPLVPQKRDSFPKSTEPAPKKPRPCGDDTLSDFDDLEAELWGFAASSSEKTDIPKRSPSVILIDSSPEQDSKMNASDGYKNFGQGNTSFGHGKTLNASDKSFDQGIMLDYTDFGQANTSFGQKNDSYGQGNTLFGQGNTSYGQGNTSFDQKNDSFGQRNTSFGQGNSSFGQSSNSFGQGNYQPSISFGQGRTSVGQGNTSFNQGNTSFDQKNTSVGQPSHQPNTSFGQGKLHLTKVNTNFGQPSTSNNYNQPSTSNNYNQPSTSSAYNQPSTSSTYNQPSVPPVIRPVVDLSSSENNKNTFNAKFKSFLKDDTEQFRHDSLLSKELRDRMYHTLRNVFGFRGFRFCQQAVVVASLLGHNSCVLMPTGAGKSLCYQLTALLSDGLTVVISPLVSLMADQVAKMKSLKVMAESLRGDTNKQTRDAIFADLKADVNMKLLYVAPEMMSKSNALLSALVNLHKKGKLTRIVIDEAHCISSWGHDFRPDYSNLSSYFKDFRGVPIMALTATATPQAVIDIRQSLKIDNSAFFISSFVRSNISYDIMPKSAANFRKLIEHLKVNHSRSSGIIYCLSRSDCDEVAQQLTQAGLRALPYHAKMGHKSREIAQNRWMCGEVKVICATIAFGMGIDKPDVRYVIHHSLPSSIENYYQETGRAGRDGLPSQCTLLYSFADHTRYLKLFQETQGNSAYQSQRIKNLYEMIGYCENTATCHRKLLVEHFGEFYDSHNCLQSLAPCHICSIQSTSGSIYKAYDFTEEALEVLKSINLMNRGKNLSATIKTISDLYRGVEKKTKGPNSMTNLRLPLFERGKGCVEGDVKKFMHKLLTEGYLSEHLEHNKFVRQDICYVKVSAKGEEFLKKKEPKFYSYMAITGKKNHSVRLYTMPVVSEAIVLKEKYKLKHIRVFREAMNELRALMIRIAREEGGETANPHNILSAEGIEQLAAMLPRTESEFLNIDSMNPDKYLIYSPRILPIIQKYWKRIDDYEHNNIKQAVRQF